MYGNQLRAHAKMISAVSCSCVPLITFIIGNAIGPTSYVMVGFNLNYISTNLFQFLGECMLIG